MVESLYFIFKKVASCFPEKDFLGTIFDDDVILYKSYFDVYVETISISNFMKKNNIQRNTIVGIFSDVSDNFFVSELAISRLWGVSCAISPMFEPNVIKYLLRETELKNIFISNKYIDFFIKQIFPEFKFELIIIYGSISPESSIFFAKKGIKVYFFDHILHKSGFFDSEYDMIKELKTNYNNLQEVDENDENNSIPNQNCELDDVSMICYTSGTSGLPKGAMITYKNLFSSIMTFVYSLEKAGKKDKNVYFSQFYFSNLIEKIGCFVTMALGGQIGFHRKNDELFMKDLQLIKPTIFGGCSYTFKKFLKIVKNMVIERKFNSKYIFDFLINFKTKRYKMKWSIGSISSIFFDSFIFKNIIGDLGIHIHTAILMFDPLEPEIRILFQSLFGIPIVDFYGMIETTGPFLFQNNRTKRHETTGIMLSDNKMKFKKTIDGKFEICVKGPTIFKGYYKNEMLNSTSFDDEGWFHTGDLCSYEDDNFHILGPKDTCFIIFPDKFIYPVILESKFRNDNIIDIFVYGKPEFSFIIALVFVDIDEELNFLDIKNLMIERSKILHIEGEIKEYEIPKEIFFIKGSRTDFLDIFSLNRQKNRKKILEKYALDIERLFVSI